MWQETRYFTLRPINTLYHISLSSSQNEKCFRKSVQEVKTHFPFFSFYSFRKSCRLLDNVNMYCTDGQYGACEFHAGYLSLQTRSKYVTITVSPLQQLLHERAPVIRTLPVLLNVKTDSVSINLQACSDHSTAMHWRAQIKKFLIKQVSLLSSLSLRYKYSPQQPVYKHPQTTPVYSKLRDSVQEKRQSWP
jgi:hypothetical protein